jgi:hypothetical protein
VTFVCDLPAYAFVTWRATRISGDTHGRYTSKYLSQMMCQGVCEWIVTVVAAVVEVQAVFATWIGLTVDSRARMVLLQQLIPSKVGARENQESYPANRCFDYLDSQKDIAEVSASMCQVCRSWKDSMEFFGWRTWSATDLAQTTVSYCRRCHAHPASTLWAKWMSSAFAAEVVPVAGVAEAQPCRVSSA